MLLQWLKLRTSKDWDLWISIVRGTAYHVWHLIDPSNPTKPAMLPQPEVPKLTIPKNIDKATKANLLVDRELLMLDYKIDCMDWERQHDGFTKIFDLIFNTLSANNLLYISNMEFHPWDILRALQQKLGPLDYARALELERELEKFQLGRKCNEATLGAGGKT
ncbi:MAG: hypothetical protein Q9199_005405 [Rusavskia elegans]